MKKCPYCNKEVEICHDDGEGYDESETYNQECPYCGKIFVYTTTILVVYDLEKAPCLNGEAPHSFKRTRTIPKKFSKMQCTVCGEERPCTENEMEAD